MKRAELLRTVLNKEKGAQRRIKTSFSDRRAVHPRRGVSVKGGGAKKEEDRLGDREARKAHSYYNQMRIWRGEGGTNRGCGMKRKAQVVSK